MKCTVSGVFLDLQGKPAVDRQVTIRLVKGGFTPEAQYLAGSISPKTAADGTLSVELWANGESETPCTYEVQVSGTDERFLFVLPPGTSALTWSEARLLGVSSNDPQYQTILEYIKNDPAFRGPPGPPGDGSGGSLVHTHTQSTPAAVWTIPNPFGVRCSVVTVRNAAGRIVLASVEDDAANIVIDFPSPVTGSAHLIRS